jgi:hypothetical protein
VIGAAAMIMPTAPATVGPVTVAAECRRHEQHAPERKAAEIDRKWNHRREPLDRG